MTINIVLPSGINLQIIFQIKIILYLIRSDFFYVT